MNQRSWYQLPLRLFALSTTFLGLSYVWAEAEVDLDADGQPDAWEIEKFGTIFATHGEEDVDSDGLTGSMEYLLGTEPLVEDTDEDTLKDGEDPAPLSADYDRDGLSDAQEIDYGTRFDARDTDDGGTSDGQEIRDGTDPLNQFDDLVDSDFDGLPNRDERSFIISSESGALSLDVYNPDSDQDGLCDGPLRTYFCDDEDVPCLPGFEHASDFGACSGGEDLDRDGFYDEPLETERCSGLGTDLETDPTLADTDGDGLLDGQERGISNPHCVDTDGDGLTDLEEFELREDFPCLELDNADSDGDFLTDAEELRGDLGTITNPCLRDTDGDGVFDLAEVFEGTNPSDASERGIDSDGDGLTDVLEEEPRGTILGRYAWNGPYKSGCNDTDGDGLSDGEEIFRYGTDPLHRDSDGDGLIDGREVDLSLEPTRFDTDGDRLGDGLELGITQLDLEADVQLLPYDCDGSGFPDAVESQVRTTSLTGFTVDAEPTTVTDPLLIDTDGDGACDGSIVVKPCVGAEESVMPNGFREAGEGDATQPDTDGDGLPDGWELSTAFLEDCDEDVSLGQVDVADDDLDQDGDGLTQQLELSLGTSPCQRDTDGDGLCDGTNPNVPECLKGEDANNNGVWDEGSESHPLEADTDGDGLDDLNDRNRCAEQNLDCSLVADCDGDGLCDFDRGVSGCISYESPYATDPCRADTDGDGIEDAIEVTGINRSSPTDADTDDDGLCDGPIGSISTDTCSGGEDLNADGRRDADETHPNKLDTDFDGLADGFEDRNQNGQIDEGETDPRKADTDGDGLSDGCYPGLEETGACEDKNNNGELDVGETDPLLADSDGDGISDGDESFVYETDPNDPFSSSQTDTDGDQIPDDKELELGLDPGNPDSDGDGLSDRIEIGDFNAPVDTDSDGVLDALDLDSDNDGLDDQFEVGANGDTPRDSDGDGIYDFREQDADGGGVSDGVEVFEHQTDPTLASDDGRGEIEAGAAVEGMGCNGGAEQSSWLILLGTLCLARKRIRCRRFA